MRSAARAAAAQDEADARPRLLLRPLAPPMSSANVTQ